VGNPLMSATVAAMTAPQTRSDTQPRLATVAAGEGHARPYGATYDDGFWLIWEQKAAGSNLAIPTVQS
jgi:hypothetical protein